MTRYDHKYRSRMMAPKLKPSTYYRGWLNAPEHRLAVASIEEAAAATKAEWFVELGTKHAGTTLMLAQVLRDLGRKASILTIDVDPKAKEYFKKHLGPMANERLTAVLKTGFSYEAAIEFSYVQAAWLLVDACHCRACVEKDIAAWCPKVVPGGLVLFHDADWRVQRRPPSQVAGHKGRQPCGVYDAVMGSDLLRREFHLVQSIEGAYDPTGEMWEGTQVWRRR